MRIGEGPGSYIPADTALHRLDARVKLALLLAWTAALFFVDAWWALAGVTAALLALLCLAGVSAAHALRSLAPLGVVVALLVCSSALRFDGTAAWPLVGAVGVSPDGLVRGLAAAVRIVLMVGLSLVVTSSTTVGALNDALLWAAAPLRRLHVPVDDLAMTLCVAVRFIPVCAEQLERTRLAQQARGARVGQGGPVRRVASWVPVVIPLFVGMFRRAEALAGAMEGRCYRGEGRTRFTGLAARPMDGAVLAAGLVLAALLAVMW